MSKSDEQSGKSHREAIALEGGERSCMERFNYPRFCLTHTSVVYPRKLEALLGLDEGSLGDTPKMVLPQEAHNYRIPDGNEGGSRANPQWRPGGKTYPGGVPEAVIDPVPKDKLTLVDIW